MAVTQTGDTTRVKFSSSERRGIVFGLLAYTIWGLSFAFYRLMPHIPPLEVVAHRAAWSVPFGIIVLGAMGGLNTIWPILRRWKVLRILMCSATIIAINWSLFVWAVAQGMFLQTSLAYYINPLVSVLLGFVLLGERLGRAQTVAVAIAAVAVLFEAIAEGVFPWLSLLLAVTFAVYGYLRKIVPVGAVPGFVVETLLIAPFAFGAMIWLEMEGSGHLFASAADAAFLLSCTVVTGVPLMLFAAAARLLPLSMIGLMQYIAPTLGFIIGVWGFNQPLTLTRLITFILIWIALAIFSWSTFLKGSAVRANKKSSS